MSCYYLSLIVCLLKGIKTLKTFYNPQTINQMNITSTTSFASLSRGVPEQSNGVQNGASNPPGNAKVVRLTLYPFTDTHLGTRNDSKTTTNFNTTHNHNGQATHTKRSLLNQESPSNSHLPQIYHKTPNNSSQVKQVTFLHCC